MATNPENWPRVEGRYKKGNLDSPVVVCTNATVEGIELDMEKVALVGKCVTENIGIEKIIQNVTANPRIRFLVLCGRISNGHFVEQAFLALKRNGVDKEKKILGAKGNTPFLKGIDLNMIERFRQQVEMVDLSSETDNEAIMRAVDDCLKKDPGAFTGEALNVAQVEVIEAKDCPDFVADPNGFFVISLAGRSILVEHFQDNKPDKKIIGSRASDIMKTIAKLGLIGQFEQSYEHAMYLGRELQKAETALQNSLEYEQDSPLIFKKPDVRESKESSDDEWFD